MLLPHKRLSCFFVAVIKTPKQFTEKGVYLGLTILKGEPMTIIPGSMAADKQEWCCSWDLTFSSSRIEQRDLIGNGISF